MKSFALLPCLTAACGTNPSIAVLASQVRTLIPTYSGQIRPILSAYCVVCHTGDGLRPGGVELDLFESARAGGQHNVCVSVSVEVQTIFAEALTAPAFAHRINDAIYGDWAVLSMPTGVLPKLTRLEQVTFACWVEAGTPP